MPKLFEEGPTAKHFVFHDWYPNLLHFHYWCKEQATQSGYHAFSKRFPDFSSAYEAFQTENQNKIKDHIEEFWDILKCPG
ncbi:hypothetical protein ACFQ49_14245 [Kroppenstedtia eburnea]|uniref:Uncharacterized protein n=1 Tax=Kroppenstedtia sanguinis TaxID=1380684 RepID=A0ABW4C810_9BACL